MERIVPGPARDAFVVIFVDPTEGLDIFYTDLPP